MNRQRRGDYKMISDLSGATFWASEMKRRWDGLWVHRSEWEARHPLDFPQPMPSEAFPKDIRPDQPYPEVDLCPPNFIGRSGQETSRDYPSYFLFDHCGVGLCFMDLCGKFQVSQNCHCEGIGCWSIEGDFVVKDGISER